MTMLRKKNSKPILGFLTVLSVAFMAVTPAITGETRSLKDVYNEAVKQYDAGQYTEALKGFERVLKNQPKYVYARNYAVKCRTAIAEGKKPVIDLEKQLAAIKIASVDFNKTDLGTVLEYLSQKCEDLSGGKISANFIYQGPNADRKNKLITFQLRNVPITEVITYVGRLSGTKFKYEQYAVVGTPIRGAAVNAASVQPLPVQETGVKKFDTPVPPNPFQKK